MGAGLLPWWAWLAIGAASIGACIGLLASALIRAARDEEDER